MFSKLISKVFKVFQNSGENLSAYQSTIFNMKPWFFKNYNKKYHNFTLCQISWNYYRLDYWFGILM